MNCAGIVRSADYDCENPIQPGVGPEIILLNLGDISGYTFGPDGVVSDIIMKAGKYGYSFKGIRQSVQPEYSLVQSQFAVLFDHTLNFSVYDISAIQKNNLERLSIGNVVAIVYNVNDVGNADTVFEIYGAKVGMETQELIRIPWSVEDGGAFRIGLKTSDAGAKESSLPYSFWDTDYQTTLNKILGLLEIPDGFPFTFPHVLI